jgi:hypothetical protein
VFSLGIAMTLRAGFLALAHKLQEAVTLMSQKDVSARLSDALSDQFRGTGTWAYLVDVFGDDKAGECVYSSGGDLLKAPYTCSETGAKIDTTKAVEVLPLTTYALQSEVGEVSEAGARHSKRDMTQLQTIHDHAVSLGADCGMKESQRNASQSTSGKPNGNEGNHLQNVSRKHGNPQVDQALSASVLSSEGDRRETSLDSINLVESAVSLDEIHLQEARADYEIKLIAPGKGSSAFYPAEVLKRDGPKVFTPGTHVYINHPTLAEEAQRPEGDVKNLAGVLTTAAVYHDNHAKGPGLYGRMKVFADHGAMVEEKAAHVGMSIRASGNREAGKTREGLPILKELTSAESVDVVTRAGAGGMILTESAISHEEAGMTLQEAQKLIADGIKEATAPLMARALKGDAREEATKCLEAVTLPEKAKQRIIERAIEGTIPEKDGVLDKEKLRETVVALAKSEGEYLASVVESGKVKGMGNGSTETLTETRKPEEIKLHALKVFERLGHSKEAAERAVKGMVA